MIKNLGFHLYCLHRFADIPLLCAGVRSPSAGISLPRAGIPFIHVLHVLFSHLDLKHELK